MISVIIEDICGIALLYIAGLILVSVAKILRLHIGHSNNDLPHAAKQGIASQIENPIVSGGLSEFVLGENRP